MSAEIIKLPEQKESDVEQIELVEADLKLKDGTLTIRQKRKKKSDETKAKSSNERQKAFAAAKEEGGYKRGWIHSDLLQLAQEAGGQEKVGEMLAAQRAVQRDLIETLKDELRAAKAAVSFAETQIEGLRFDIDQSMTREADASMSLHEVSTELAALERKMSRIPGWIQRLFR